MRRVIISALAIASMVGCAKMNEGSVALSSDVEATFATSQIVTRTSGNTWEANDEVGIYMYKSGTSDNTYALARENVKYQSDASGTFSLMSGEAQIYYPQVDEVDFYAYYPYQALTAEGYYTADITDQNLTGGDFDQGAVDFMTASLTQQSKSATAVSFEFDHKLAMLTLVITPNNDIEDLSDVEVTLSSMNTVATFNTITGAMNSVVTPALGSVQFLTSDTEIDGNSNVIEVTATAIVLPESLATTAELTFTFSPTESYTAQFPTETAFAANKNHTYNVSVGYDRAIFEGCNIVKWGDTLIDGVIDADEI